MSRTVNQKNKLEFPVAKKLCMLVACSQYGVGITFLFSDLKVQVSVMRTENWSRLVTILEFTCTIICICKQSSTQTCFWGNVGELISVIAFLVFDHFPMIYFSFVLFPDWGQTCASRGRARVLWYNFSWFTLQGWYDYSCLFHGQATDVHIYWRHSSVKSEYIQK